MNYLLRFGLHLCNPCNMQAASPCGHGHSISSSFQQFPITSLQVSVHQKKESDSFPVATCENIRICRSKLITGKQYRGYKPSMRKYFYGFTVQVITTMDGIPVEFEMLPGCYHDIDLLFLQY